MSILDQNENINVYIDIINPIIKRFLNTVGLNMPISDKCYLLANKTKKEIEYDNHSEHWWLMFNRNSDGNDYVFIAKLRPNWRIGNENIFIVCDTHKVQDKYSSTQISLDYILTNYNF